MNSNSIRFIFRPKIHVSLRVGGLTFPSFRKGIILLVLLLILNVLKLLFHFSIK